MTRSGASSARSRTRTVAATALALTLALSTAGPSSAQPDVTDDDVRAAQQAVASTASAVATLEVELATQSAALDTAWTAVAAAAEGYTQALVDSEVAATAAAQAADREAAAAVEVETARDELGVIAMQAYRSGGSLDGLGALLSADGFDDLIARTAAMEQLGERAQRAVQRFQAADLVARTLGARAEDAALEAEQATAAAQDALAAAETAQADAEQKVAETAVRREALIAELAAQRQTSVEVERARQATLDAERQAREEAAAAAERGVSRPANPTSPPSSPPVTAPPVTTPPVSTPPVAAPPVTPPVTAPPVTAPPVAAPVVTPPPAPPVVTPPPVTAPDPYGLGTGSQRGTAAQGDAAVAWALQQVGKSYSYGAAGPEAFDCSGLTMRAWGAAGLSINRTSRDQYRQVRKITYDSMRPGDLIFYGSVGSDPGSITHVAMYVGNGTMVEAPRPGVAVRATPIRWNGTMPFAGRP